MSYRDLPFSLYQFQTKFRSELRAKSGLLRGREFLMKDLYSFHATAEDLEKYYQDSIKTYMAIYNRVGIGEQTVLTFASGGSFTKYSHEFQTINEAGEDTIYVCPKCNIAINNEIITDQPNCPQCGATRDQLVEKRAIEVGNIFQLKQKYSEPFALNFKDQDGTDKPVLMGCYGIGLGRLMATIIEVHHDDNGMIWPAAVAPYQVHLVRLGDEAEVAAAADKAYEELQQAGWEVLYDDREASAGVKLKDADLLGLPLRLVISQKTLAAGKIEWKLRAGTESHTSKDVLTAAKEALA
jgi:prolyl-tRNA synthetase